MANQKHLLMLLHSIERWNIWREENPEIQPDLSDVDLRGIDLSLADLSSSNLSLTNLSDANLIAINFITANLSGAKLNGANISGANLTNATLRKADLSNADLSNANLSVTYLKDADLRGADLNDARLRGAYLNCVDFSGAELSGIDFSDTYLSNIYLSGSNLSYTNFSYTNLSYVYLDNADLSNANLTGTNLSNANLSRAYLYNAKLRGARLRGTNLYNAKLNGADLYAAVMDRTILGELDLRKVKGLDTIRHEGPSHLSINTIYKSEGDIPEVFLRGTGAPDNFIEYMHALAAKPIQYYTCFISYSSKNEDFAEQLYADLQSKGVRCWFAPEDMKTGDKIRHRIDTSIRLYDKLLLILSEASVESQWVEHEVETAIGKEIEGRANVLFPVRLDDAVLQSKVGWASHIKLTRHITDFSQWKHHDAYQKSLDRLLRDLKADIAR